MINQVKLTPEFLEFNGFTWEYGQDSCNSQWFRHKDLPFALEYTGYYKAFYLHYSGKKLETVGQVKRIYKVLYDGKFPLKFKQPKVNEKN